MPDNNTSFRLRLPESLVERMDAFRESRKGKTRRIMSRAEVVREALRLFFRARHED